jgi:hypothetical protein
MAAEAYVKKMNTVAYAHAAFPGALERLLKNLETERGITFDERLRQKVREALIDPKEYVVTLPKVYTMRSFTVADTLTDIFLRCHWSIIQPRSGFFITSDNPVLRQVHQKSVHPIYGDHGFKNKSMQVTFPLSPKKMLLLTYTKPLLKHWTVRREVVEHLNTSRAAHAEHELYCHIKHIRITKLALKFKGAVKPGVELIGFGPKSYSEVIVPRRFKPKTPS